ncbi:hypothetical protein NE865_06860 [Phthorimaea operculella]|nr:hypothetical protein NE865_06860 [Phthorimaea operculella]
MHDILNAQQVNAQQRIVQQIIVRHDGWTVLKYGPGPIMYRRRIKTDEKNYLERLSAVRKNIKLVLHYGNVTPFLWYTKGYRCFYCEKPVKDVENLKEHTIKHQKVDLETFLQRRIIMKDVPVKIDITGLQCKVCPEKLNDFSDLTEHLNIVHGEQYDSSTEICFFPFVLSKTAPMSCCICATVFDNITCLVTHMYKEHLAHKCLCTICGKSFSDKTRLQRHSKKSHIGQVCSLCDVYFDAYSQLQRHRERVHHMKRLHECNLCSATFENQYQVKVHLGKEHNVEKYRIKCEFCPKVSTTKGAMMLHVQSVHSDNKYECDLCSYTCSIKWMIKLHKRKHFGQKDYNCTLCQKKFGRSSNLRTHMKIHTGKVGRVCRWCKQGFADTDTLTKHEMETHYFA